MEPQNHGSLNPPEHQNPNPQIPDNPPNPAQPLQAPSIPAPQIPIAPQLSTPNLTAQKPPSEESSHLTASAEKLKKLSIQVMIGGVIGAAILAVVAVLAGSFNETFGKALFTLFLVIVHALACLAFIEQTGKSKQSSFKFFENSVFFIIVLSFFTSIFGVWGLLDGEIVGRLYGTYFILLFACLHGQMLVQAQGKQASIDNMVYVNYVLMGLVILLILPIIWSADSDFPGIYYRLLAALGIIDGTLTILIVIFHRLYIQKHPEEQSTIFSVTTKMDANGQPVLVQSEVQKRRTHPLILLLGILIIGQFVISLLFAVLGAFYR